MDYGTALVIVFRREAKTSKYRIFRSPESLVFIAVREHPVVKYHTKACQDIRVWALIRMRSEPHSGRSSVP